SGQCRGQPDDDLDHLVLGDELGQLVQIAGRAFVAGQRNEWRREDGSGITQCDPDPYGADIDPQPTAGSRIIETRPIRLGHLVAATSAARSAATASGMPAGLAPPPCAMSGLPPPRPSMAGAKLGTSLPAARPLSLPAAVVA